MVNKNCIFILETIFFTIWYLIDLSRYHSKLASSYHVIEYFITCVKHTPISLLYKYSTASDTVRQYKTCEIAESDTELERSSLERQSSRLRTNTMTSLLLDPFRHPLPLFMHCYFFANPPPPPQVNDIIKGQPLMYSNLYSHVILHIFLLLLFLLPPPPPPHIRIFHDNYNITGWWLLKSQLSI